MDQRTLTAIEKLGLPNTAEGLRELMDEKWSELNNENLGAGSDEDKRRKAFVRILERAVGADLEGKIDALKAEAEKLS